MVGLAAQIERAGRLPADQNLLRLAKILAQVSACLRVERLPKREAIAEPFAGETRMQAQAARTAERLVGMFGQHSRVHRFISPSEQARRRIMDASAELTGMRNRDIAWQARHSCPAASSNDRADGRMNVVAGFVLRVRVQVGPTGQRLVNG